MSEHDVVLRTATPATTATLRRDLQALGLQPGMLVLVHSSLSRLGWICGGAQAVVQALLDVLGPNGTLVMPTHTPQLSDPAGWQAPPVPEEWWEPIRHGMPAFDPNLTPTYGMGAIVECFRHVPGVLRSYHPHASFAAHGPLAYSITRDHALNETLGERSPLGRIYTHDGWVLLLGVGHENNTSLHLAEYRANFATKRIITTGAPLQAEGQQRWVIFQDIDYITDDFAQIGADFAAARNEWQAGTVGMGKGMLMRQRALVDFAVTWMESHRRG